jgi:hypothetical protein
LAIAGFGKKLLRAVVGGFFFRLLSALKTKINLVLPVLSAKSHPAAARGPHDSRYLFDRFIELMEQRIGARG